MSASVFAGSLQACRRFAVHDLHVEVAISITPITHAEPEGDAPAPPSPTGNYCDCGGPMVQTGSCETCQWCGESSGGCG